MNRILVAIGGAFLLTFGIAPSAKLPAPTAEEKSAAAAKAEKDAAAKSKAAKELGKAQDRLGERYGNSKNKAARSSSRDSTTARDPRNSSGRR